MQEIRWFFASEQKIYNSLNKGMVTKYFLIVFALSLIHSFWVENDYLVNLINDFEHNLFLYAIVML